MKILMTAVPFYPHIGGIETVTQNLADEFVRMGHKVKIVTAQHWDGIDDFSYEVIRRPSARQMWKSYMWCDVFVQQGISLKWIWPLLLRRKPWFTVWHMASGFGNNYRDRLKKLCSKLTNNILVSETVRRECKLNGDVILNPFNNEVFSITNKAERRDFVFLGRLIPEKGVDVMLDAFEMFKQCTDSDWKLHIIGGGETPTFHTRIDHMLHKSDIILHGFQSPKDSAAILNRCHTMIVPSVCMEAFGVVVLEGMACGCFVIGSDGTGIEEAMRQAGFPFKLGSAKALCQSMIEVVNLSAEEIEKKQYLMRANIGSQSLHKVAQRYIDVFEKNMK